MSAPLWISHRGFREQSEENTLAAFRSAVERGFPALETDLRVTKDGHIVLLHDPTLERLSGDARRVCDLTRRELGAVRFPRGGTPLFLDQFMEEFGALSWTLDIKPEAGMETIAGLAAWANGAKRSRDLVERGRFATWRVADEAALLQSFPAARLYARPAQCRRAGLSLLVGVPGLGGIRPGRTYSLEPRFGPLGLFRRELVQGFHSRGARTLAFLPGNDAEARAAVEAGFDEILTDGLIVASGPS